MHNKYKARIKYCEVSHKSIRKSKHLWDKPIIRSIRSGELHKALNLYINLPEVDSIHLNDRTFVSLLNACATLRDVRSGFLLHAEVARLSLVDQSLFVGSALVDMYSKCGLLEKAQEVFDLLPSQNIVSWTALMLGFGENGHEDRALAIFEQIKDKGLSPNAITLLCGLKACTRIRDIERGRLIHSEIERQQYISKDPFVGNALITMYSKCGFLLAAQEVFDKLPSQGIVSWTALITGYAEHGHDQEALACFKQMQSEGVPMDAIMSICGLKLCCNIGAFHVGNDIHAEVERIGLSAGNVVVGNTLLHFYAKLGLLSRAREVFDNLSLRNVYTWAILMAGYVEHEDSEKALEQYVLMQHAGVIPDEIIYVCCLKACGLASAVETGSEAHADVERRGLIQSNVVIGNTVVEMYARWGLLRKAHQVFDELPVRNVDSWNALIAGYSYCEYGEQVLKCFEQMQLEGISPNIISFVCSLKACGSVWSIDKGREIHGEVGRLGFLESDDMIGNSLIDMYAKCGLLATAQEVFDHLLIKDVVSWNALLTGYAQLGETWSALDIFDKMLGNSIRPDLITCVIICNACSGTSIVDKNQTFFEAMTKDYGVLLNPQSLFGFIGLDCQSVHPDKSSQVIRKVPCRLTLPLWRALLNTCSSWGNVVLGKEAFEQATCLDQQDSSAYVLLSQTYATA